MQNFDFNCGTRLISALNHNDHLINCFNTRSYYQMLSGDTARRAAEAFSAFADNNVSEVNVQFLTLQLNNYFQREENVEAMMLRGVIPLVNWDTKQELACQNKLVVERWITTEEHHFNNLTEQRNQLIQTLNNLKTKIDSMAVKIEDSRRRLGTLHSYIDFLRPLIQAEKKLRESYTKARLGNVEDFTVDHVCLFLVDISLSTLVPVFQQKQVTGEKLLSFASVSGFHLLTNDALLASKLEFYTKLLSAGCFFDQKPLESISLWRHIEPERTIVFLKEYGISLAEQTIRNRSISICQLIYLRVGT